MALFFLTYYIFISKYSLKLYSYLFLSYLNLKYHGIQILYENLFKTFKLKNTNSHIFCT